LYTLSSVFPIPYAVNLKNRKYISQVGWLAFLWFAFKFSIFAGVKMHI